ncbi:MAG: HlyC/CorC family transporter, partial [Gammaproteobacteria bacterium]|nr:HlyC/CorC family transporter [Gammaproteobacteria bacterium]
MFGEFLILFALIVVNGFFAMAELAVVSSRRTRLQHLAGQGSGGARAALRLLEAPTRFLSSVQIGITLIGVLAGVYSGAKFAEPLAAWLVGSFAVDAKQAEAGSFAVVVVLVTYLSLIVGELVPKRWAMSHPEAIATVVARPMEWVAFVTAPLVWLLQRSTEAILALTGLKSHATSSVTEEEVRSLIAEGTREGIFAHAEHRMIDGVLKLADRNVRSVMVPRGDIVWLDVEDSPEAVRSVVEASGHSRYMVCRGEVDELVGVVHVRELIQWLRGTGDLAAFA